MTNGRRRSSSFICNCRVDTVYVVRAVRVGVKADELIMDMRRVLEPSLLLVGIYNPTNNLGVEAGLPRTVSGRWMN